jgi:hypothetical protein
MLLPLQVVAEPRYLLIAVLIALLLWKAIV